MSINWDPPEVEEIVEKVENTTRLTICSLYHATNRNTLLLTLPQTFPDIRKLQSTQNIYFADINGKIVLSLNPIVGANVFDRRIQPYGAGTDAKYFRVPIPIQLRKMYDLEQYKKVHLIATKGYYECVFI